MISKYKTIHILLPNVHLDCRGRVPVTGMLAGMNLSKPGMNLSKPGRNLSKPGKKHNNHVIIVVETPCFNKNLPASTENLPLEILAVEHTSYTKFLGSK